MNTIHEICAENYDTCAASGADPFLEHSAICQTLQTRDADRVADADLAFTAGRIEGLKDTMRMLPDFDFVEPSKEFDEVLPECSECHAAVNVKAYTNWSNGDICHHCASAVVNELPNKINAAISALEKP